MDQLRGKLRQKQKDGPYYYRLTVFNGKRKEFALKTCDFLEACQKAAELDSVWEAPTKEVAIAQITNEQYTASHVFLSPLPTQTKESSCVQAKQQKAVQSPSPHKPS